MSGKPIIYKTLLEIVIRTVRCEIGTKPMSLQEKLIQKV